MSRFDISSLLSRLSLVVAFCLFAGCSTPSSEVAEGILANRGAAAAAVSHAQAWVSTGPLGPYLPRGVVIEPVRRFG